jgi:hypothetical protein
LKYFAIILAMCLSCGAVASSSGSSTQRGQSDGLAAYQRDEAKIVEYLRPALNASTTTVQLFYAAKCAAGTDIPPIPPIRFQKASRPNTGFSAVRMIFRGDGNVAVTEGPKGIVRISIGDVPKELLRTHIRVFKLQPIEQYNPSLVISALEDTKEMESAMVALGLSPSAVLHMQLLMLPQKGFPHFPPVLRDVTASQVLDLLTETFRGVVTYGVCTQGPAGRPLFINFVGFSPVMR